MSIRSNGRQFTIQAVMIAVAALWVLRLMQLQLFDSSYALQADSNVIERVVQYPSRGLVLDVKDRPLVDNRVAYDVMVSYSQVKTMDTAKFCSILEIDKKAFVHNLHRDFSGADKLRFSRNRPYPFLKNVSHTQYTRLQESLYEFSGFFVQNRTVRAYPDSIGCHLIGYMSEVTEDQVKKLPDYMRGDYIGMTALEKYYEKEMRGKPGIKYVLRDNLGRQQGRYENGERDSVAVSGKDLLTSVDLDLQKLGESFMRNKRGAIVAVDPSTGEILALVSGPSYDPNALSVSNRSRNRNLLAFYQDPNKPLINHALNAKYPPGSTFKTGMAALEIQLGWDPNRSVGCGGGYRLSARKVVKCHRHTGTGNIAGAVQHSCNTYFCSSFYHTLNSFPTVSAGLDTVDNYLRDYGFGRKVGIDLSGESIGNLPSPKLYNKAYHEGGWNANTIISMGIGQGEVLVTPVQMVNLAQTIANKGWYYVPHVVKGFRFNGKTLPTDKKFTTKHKMRINPQHFEWVVEGMNNMAKNNKNVFVPDLDICGKTGTAQNPHGKDNSAFISFAPRNNPRIAVAVYVENAGFGAQFAAPIASMMIEQYLNGTVKRDALLKKMRTTSLVKTFVPDTSRMQPVIQINTTLLPRKDTAPKIAPTIIKPAPLNTTNAPIAPPTVPPTAPSTATLPQSPATKPTEPQ